MSERPRLTICAYSASTRLLCHTIQLPLVTYSIVTAFGITGAMAVGFMIISACPTGATSNLLTYHARADVALAVTFTAITSAFAMLTVPIIISWSLAHVLDGATSASVPVNLPVDIVIRQILWC